MCINALKKHDPQGIKCQSRDKKKKKKKSSDAMFVTSTSQRDNIVERAAE